MAEGVGCRVGRFSGLGVQGSRCYGVGCGMYGNEGHHVDFQGHHNPPHLLFGGGWVEVYGFRVQGVGFMVYGLGCRVYGSGCRVQGI